MVTAFNTSTDPSSDYKNVLDPVGSGNARAHAAALPFAYLSALGSSAFAEVRETFVSSPIAYVLSPFSFVMFVSLYQQNPYAPYVI